MRRKRRKRQQPIAATSGDEKKSVCVTAYQELFDVHEQTTVLGRYV